MAKQHANLLRQAEPQMKQIQITVWHNTQQCDWSLQIDGALHRNITTDVLESLVEAALVNAQVSLEDLASRSPGFAASVQH